MVNAAPALDPSLASSNEAEESHKRAPIVQRSSKARVNGAARWHLIDSCGKIMPRQPNRGRRLAATVLP